MHDFSGRSVELQPLPDSAAGGRAETRDETGEEPLEMIDSVLTHDCSEPSNELQTLTAAAAGRGDNI